MCCCMWESVLLGAGHSSLGKIRYGPLQVKKYEEQHGSNKSTYWVIFELIWRDFFRSAPCSMKTPLMYVLGGVVACTWPLPVSES